MKPLPPPVFFQSAAQIMALLLIALLLQLRYYDPLELKPDDRPALKRLNEFAAASSVVAIMVTVAGEVAALTALSSGATEFRLALVRNALAAQVFAITFAATLHIARPVLVTLSGRRWGVTTSLFVALGLGGGVLLVLLLVTGLRT